MATVVREIQRLAEQRLGLARLLFSFEVRPYDYDKSESFQMDLWRSFESVYVDEKGKYLPPLDEPLWVLAQAFFPKKMAKTTPGIGELMKSTEDALIKSGVINRRGLIESYDLSRKLIMERPPRLTVFIFKMPSEL